LSDWIEERFRLPVPNVPDLREMGPEHAAAAIREHWRLGVTPIASLVHLLELHGVHIFSLAERAREVDAYSLWHGGKPYCFLNTIKSVEHSRFDGSHELGHLVLHRHAWPRGREAELEASAFGSAFLMPPSTVLATVPKGAPLRQLVELKKLWNVSVAALAHRAHRLGILSEWHYRGLCIEMNRLGYSVSEPEPMQSRETSQVLNKVFSSLREDGISKDDVATDLGIYQKELDSIVFGLVVTSVDGGRSGQPPDGSNRAARLRLL